MDEYTHLRNPRRWREKETESLFKEKNENFLNLDKEMGIQIQGTQSFQI